MRIVHDIGEGFHKLGRILLAAITTVVVGYVVVHNPEISIDKLMMIISAPLTYIGVKGRGYQPSKKDKNPVTDADFTD